VHAALNNEPFFAMAMMLDAQYKELVELTA